MRPERGKIAKNNYSTKKTQGATRQPNYSSCVKQGHLEICVSLGIILSSISKDQSHCRSRNPIWLFFPSSWLASNRRLSCDTLSFQVKRGNPFPCVPCTLFKTLHDRGKPKASSYFLLEGERERMFLIYIF